ncbi:MAG: hypothetical protein BWX70_03139 [Verrucomicrobia bacterium ADurb.Bin070]|nr:MAG: hypothetical protein BWX70_03139 [Verrucomicrobia bacterium ADurb.Bin070]
MMLDQLAAVPPSISLQFTVSLPTIRPPFRLIVAFRLASSVSYQKSLSRSVPPVLMLIIEYCAPAIFLTMRTRSVSRTPLPSTVVIPGELKACNSSLFPDRSQSPFVTHR